MLKISQFLRSNLEQTYIGVFRQTSGIPQTADYVAGIASKPISELSRVMLDDQKWKMGFITYEEKNRIEDLSSRNSAPIHFPQVLFFIPDNVRIISTEKTGIANGIFPTKKISGIKCRVEKPDYIERVNMIKKHIAVGDIYELNFCMEFFAENAEVDPVALFLQLNDRADAPFSCFVKAGSSYLIGASPERFLKKSGNTLASQPMKGTKTRGSEPEEDLRFRERLSLDSKERAENIMITDLVRNDLSRIAEKGSVSVDELCEVYSYKTVHQLISTVSCKLSKGTTFENIIHASFPMGSMTGAPKISAMTLIDKYEESGRGLYSGCAGFIDPAGDFDLSVVIRSILYDSDKKYLSFSVGSAITAASDPESEYEECLLKARAMMDVLGTDFSKFA